jgi:hypothetical protein
MPEKLQARILLQINEKKGMFMKRLFGGATLLWAAFSADAGLIRADFRTGAGLPGYGSFGAGDEPGSSIFPSAGSGWDSGEAWPDLDPATNTLTLQAQDHVDFQASGATVTGITFLTQSPAEDPTSIPEPGTLVLFGLGAGALGLARQGKSKRA